MSLHAYQASIAISAGDPPFSAIIMAALRKADSTNRARLEAVFPEITAEFMHRYWSGGGLLPGEDGYDPRTDDSLCAHAHWPHGPNCTPPQPLP